MQESLVGVTLKYAFPENLAAAALLAWLACFSKWTRAKATQEVQKVPVLIVLTLRINQVLLPSQPLGPLGSSKLCQCILNCPASKSCPYYFQY